MIKYPERIKQVIDFTGLGNGTLSPSDIDMTLEFDNEYLFLFELKLEGIKVPIGQKLLLNRICDCWQKVNKECFVMYCEHNTTTDKFIAIDDIWIQSIYHNGKKYKGYWKLNPLLEKIALKYNIYKLKKVLGMENEEKKKKKGQHKKDITGETESGLSENN